MIRVPDALSKVADILDRLDDAADDGSSVSLGAVVDAFGARGYGPFLIAPALLVLTPLGAIPAVPSLLAALIVLFSIQMTLGRDQMWLPERVKKWSVSREKVDASTDRLRPIADRLDRWFHGRLEWLTEGPAVRIAATACALLALTVPPLELLPFASAAPMAAIAAFGLALTVKDGALMLVAIVLMVAAVAIGLGFAATPG